MRTRWLCVSILSAAIAVGGCGRRLSVTSGDMTTEAPTIRRFDSLLYQWIDTDDSSILDRLKRDYSVLLPMLENTLFEAAASDTVDYFERLINYYSEPTLKSLYKDAITYYSEDSAFMSAIRCELGASFGQIVEQSLTETVPAMSFHVSGLRQNVIVGDSMLSCSIDKYLGVDYPLYSEFFNRYQRRGMRRERLAPDCLSAWLRSEFPFKGDGNVLAERMIYEGKILYVLSKAGGYTLSRLLSMPEEELRWLASHESAIWTYINERNHLHKPDKVTSWKYFMPTPSVFISEQAPGNVGSFVGYRIVEQYMKQTGVTTAELLQNRDIREIITRAKYKPK